MSEVRDAPAGAAALPPGCEAYRSTTVFTAATIPPGLLGWHRTAPSTWALIHVLAGRLLYRVLDPHSERILDPVSPPGLVEPGVPHQVAPLGPLRFRVEFYRMRKATAGFAATPTQSAGGAECPCLDPQSLAHLRRIRTTTVRGGRRLSR